MVAAQLITAKLPGVQGAQALTCSALISSLSAFSSRSLLSLERQHLAWDG